MQIFKKALVISIILIALVGCSRTMNYPEINDSDSFRIFIGELDNLGAEVNLGYTVESSWSLLQEWYPTGATFIIQISDIDNYDWDGQVLTLTQEASADFQSIIKSAKHMMAFVITVNHEPQYGGIFLFRGSAMGISFPVIYAEPAGDKFTFTIRPGHSVLNDYEPSDDWHGIDSSVIKNVLCKAVKLTP